MSRFIWPKASSNRVAQSLSGHSAIGITAAALLYILCISGVLSVFVFELQRWEQPNAPEMTAIDPQVIQKAGEAVMAMQEEETAHFFVHLPTEGLPRTVITTDTQAVFISADGSVGNTESHPWTQSVLDLHYYLHLPRTLGLTIVGMLGVLLLALSISGFLAHPRIFRDAFSLRLSGNVRLAKADLHNRLSVWTSPFLITSALTGAMLGLASVVAYSIAVTDYDGDIEAVYAPVFGAEPEMNETPAPLPRMDNALRHMAEQYPNAVLTYVILHEPQTEGQHLQILGELPRRLIFGEYYNFDQNGVFTGKVGMSDGTAGQQIIASMYQLHFGSFGGLPIKLAYAVFGIALAVIISAGIEIYFLKRREKGQATPRLEAMWSGIVWGTPAALALTLVLSTADLVTGAVLPVLFWTSLAAIIIAASLSGERKFITYLCRPTTGVLIFLAMSTQLYRYRDGFESPAAIAVTLVGFALAIAFLAPDFQRLLSKKRTSPATHAPNPAE